MFLRSAAAGFRKPIGIVSYSAQLLRLSAREVLIV